MSRLDDDQPFRWESYPCLIIACLPVNVDVLSAPYTSFDDHVQLVSSTS